MTKINTRPPVIRPLKILTLCLPLILAAPLLVAEEPEAGDAAPAERSGFFTNVGFGTGFYFFDDAPGSPGSELLFTIGIDNRIGTRIDGHFSIFLLTHFNITTFQSVTDFSNWVFSENDLRLLLTPFIPFAIAFESQLFVGPGLLFHTNVRAPSLYVEAGLGYSSVQSISRQTFIMGAGLFAGAGVEIIPRLSCGLRLIWSPSFLHSGWTPNDNNYFSLMVFLHIL